MSDAELYETEFTVVICTVNRRKYLERAVSEVLRQLDGFPKGHLLVVDNGSSDDTETYLDEVRRRSCKCVSVKEPRQGVYYARVRAIDEARGKCLVFLDDDAIPQPGWLQGLLCELLSSAKVGVVGCAVEPVWEAPRPQWLSKRLMRELPAIPGHSEREKAAFPSFPPGISLGLRLNECARLYAGPERRQSYPLGRTSTSREQSVSALIGGEDSDLCEIYARNGYEVIFLGHVTVGHHVQAERLSREWYLRKVRSEGHLRIRLSRLCGYGAINRYSVNMIACLPAFALLRVLAPMLRGATRVLVEAYYMKCLGAWSELLFGPAVAPLPYECCD